MGTASAGLSAAQFVILRICRWRPEEVVGIEAHHGADAVRSSREVDHDTRVGRFRRRTVRNLSVDALLILHMTPRVPGSEPGLPEGCPGPLLCYSTRERDRPVTAEAIITKTAATAIAMSQRTQSIPGLPFPPNAV